jgi:hypothetical protein
MHPPRGFSAERPTSTVWDVTHIPVWVVAKESLRFTDTPGARPGHAYLTADPAARLKLADTVRAAATWMAGLDELPEALELLRSGQVNGARGSRRPALAYWVVADQPGPPRVVLGEHGTMAMFPADAELICLLADVLDDPPQELICNFPMPKRKAVRTSQEPKPGARQAERSREPRPGRQASGPDPQPQLAKGSRTPRPDPPPRRMRPAPVRFVSGGLPGLGKRQ